jgi:hypothetical protein
MTQVFALLLVDGINTVFEITFIYLCLIPHFGKSGMLMNDLTGQ